jgi:putative oxidoreductase
MSDVSNLSRLNKPEPRISSATERRMFSSLNKARRLHAAGWAPIPLRLVVGYGFMAHGYVKLMKGPDVFVGILHALGVPAPHVMAWLTILVELLGGLAVLLGAFVPLVSLPMAAVLLVAMFTVHLPYGFTSIKLMAVTAAGPQFGPPGYETDLLYLACLAALVVGGSGSFALDGLLANRAPRKKNTVL